MRDSRFFLLFLLTVAVQILISNFLNLSQFVMINLMPALILCIPYRISSPILMLITFIAGFFVDLMAGGVLGLTLVALLPVAFARNIMLNLVLGSDTLSRLDSVSLAKHGSTRISLVLLILLMLFMLIYIWTDAAGTRPVWFLLVKFLCSTIVSYAISLLLVKIAAP